MKMRFLMALIVAMITVNAVAQNNNRQQTREYPSKDMISELKLSTDQVTALKEADTKFQTSLRSQANQSDRTKMMDAMKKARMERLADIKRTITDHDQYMSFLEYEYINPSMSGMPFGNRQGNNQRPRNNNNANADFGFED